jgi:hypothetical protein
MRYWAAVLFVVACACAPTASAKVDVEAKAIGGAVAVDGGHLVAWGDRAGTLTVLDDQTGAKTAIALDRPCDHIYAIDGSNGLFLVDCGITGPVGPETQQLVVDAATGDVTDLVGDSYKRIGRHWLQGSVDIGGRAFILYTEMHTGETRTVRQPRSGQIQTPYDLDSPDLEPVALAAPAFVVGDSMALEQVRAGKRWAIRLVGPSIDRRIYTCAHRCELVSVKGGLALWREGARRLHGYVYGKRRLREWQVPESATVRGSSERRVYYLTPRPASPLFADLRSFTWR